ncbi:transglycosylase domain-containing protein [Microbacterium allomyrinae]|uniref:Transglycosylase domain-containing protein n=1 Tax=Microbacterium allomyrinae TaxID=2830666 RepID=A0A9X1S272_9MICO|nr:transglycosylase domain-containing protein [Microbacterium allomyrinae]MCC2031017.1 transglycosylase domain-containing protein [Microbacterium allomyrinae]
MPDTKRTASGVLGGLAGLVGLSAVAGVLIAATVTPAVALTGTAAERAITMFDNLPSVLEIDKLMLPSNFYATDAATGESTLMTKFLEQDRTPVTFEQIAPVMYDSILSSEDPRYYQHGGVDLIGTTRAVLSNAQGGGETQGGSTISQQYVKNVLIQKCEQNAEAEPKVDDDGEPVLDKNGEPEVISREQALLNCWSDATTADGSDGYTRKLQEMRYAIALEQKYSKNDILLGYLNIANFGGVTYGIEAAARHYFSTSASQLTIAQAAALAGMVQNPNRYRIDKPEGSIVGAEDVLFNKAADGVIDEGANIGVLDSLLESGEITPEQHLAAADAYTSTKVRQLYVLSRLLDDGKITREQYIEAAVWPISPAVTEPTTGCKAAGGAAYFCQYVKYVILKDPAFGETAEDRQDLLNRGGLNVYTTLDSRVQGAAEAAMTQYAPSAIDMRQGSTVPSVGVFGSTTVSIEATTGRILAMAQNTQFNEDASAAGTAGVSAQVYAGDSEFGNSIGFSAGSTFKLFTLIDWLEKGKSVNETLNGTLRIFKKLTVCGETWTNNATKPTGNFGGDRGRVGTPMQFTASSLNTGYFAMAEKLDLCDIANVATKMGVTQGNGDPIKMDSLNTVIGTASVSPLAMAGAYATVANNGTYCQPQVIDRVTDADGNELAKPERTCSQVIEPKVAATAAYALQGVMNGGTGRQGNPYDGTPLIGKTGTHEEIQSWLIESSTKVATATWAGNVQGGGDIFKTYANGSPLSNIRYNITKAVQGAANAAYGGDAFAGPDTELTKQVLTDLPSVIGLSPADAQAKLEAAGFTVTVGDAVDSDLGGGVIAAQNPAAGKVAGGTSVTINPSNGQAVAVPNVAGASLDDAKKALRSAGFGNIAEGTCTTDASAAQPRTTGTNPAAGTVVNRNAAISVDYASANCRGGGNG